MRCVLVLNKSYISSYAPSKCLFPLYLSAGSLRGAPRPIICLHLTFQFSASSSLTSADLMSPFTASINLINLWPPAFSPASFHRYRRCSSAPSLCFVRQMDSSLILSILVVAKDKAPPFHLRCLQLCLMFFLPSLETRRLADAL